MAGVLHAICAGLVSLAKQDVDKMQLITKEDSKKSYNSKMYAINQWQKLVITELEKFASIVKQSNNEIDADLQLTTNQLRILRAKCYLNQCLVDNLNSPVFKPSDMANFI